jgi:succinate dehydrogenase / fumarate reductase cytochrome b subunit
MIAIPMSRQVHSLAGAVVLNLFLWFHLWKNWPALLGREAWLSRGLALGGALEASVALLFVTALVTHIALWPRGTETREQALVGSPALRQVQRITGIGALVFLGYHLYHVFPSRLGMGVFITGAYDVLWDSLGEPVTLAIYVIGVSFLYFHLAQGLCRAAVTWNWISRASSAKALRYAAGAVGFVLWGLTLQLISHFATGQKLFG